MTCIGCRRKTKALPVGITEILKVNLCVARQLCLVIVRQFLPKHVLSQTETFIKCVNKITDSQFVVDVCL